MNKLELRTKKTTINREDSRSGSDNDESDWSRLFNPLIIALSNALNMAAVSAVGSAMVKLRLRNLI